MIQVIDSLGQLKVTGAGGGGGGNTGSISAGTTRGTLGEVVFSNSNGISFGINGQTLTAQHNGLTSQSNQAFSAQGGSSAFQTLSFNNANGATFSNNGGAVELSYTVPSVAGLLSNIRVSAGTTSNLLSAFTFNNGNGLTFGLDASTITGSHNGITSQTNQNITLFATGNTTQNSSTVINANSLLFGGRGNVSVGFSNGSIQISDTGAAGGGITNINISAGTTSNNLSAFTLSNSNNMTFGLDGSTVTASFNAINMGVSTFGNTAGTTGTVEGAGGQYILVGSNGISLSQSTNGAASGTVTILGGINTQRMAWPPGNFTAVAAMGNGSFSINRMQNYCQMSATRMEVPFQVSLASSATANTWGLQVTVIGCVYTKNVSTLSSLSSGSTAWSISLASNSAGQTQVIPNAIRPMSIPININMSVGEYYVGFGISTNTSSVGTATTALGNTWSVFGGPIYSSAIPQVGEFTATTNTSTGLWGGQGIYSAAISTVPPTVSLSAINQTGSYYARGNMGIIFRNI